MSNYRQLFKSTALLGGTQVILTIVGMVRNKLLAVMLGPAGVGLAGLYTSITTLAGTLTGFGLGGSGVRHLAEASGAGDLPRVARLAIIVNRVVYTTSLCGAGLVWLFCRPITVATFGNLKYTTGVALMGLVVICSGISYGQLAILQGMQRIRDLVNCQLLGAVFGTIVSVLVVYFLRERGVALFLVANAAFGILTSSWYVRKITLARVRVSLAETFHEVRLLAGLGIAMMVTGLLGSGVAYCTRIIIIHKLGLPATGQYQAAFTLSSYYVGFILNAISTDFFPRLSGLVRDPQRASRLLNDQIEIGMLLAAPGITATLVLAPLVLRILYTGDFVAAAAIVQWQVIGVFFRMISNPLWHIQIARNLGRLLMVTESIGAVIQLFLNWYCIQRWGLEGIGVAYLLYFILQTTGMYFLCRRLSGFAWSRRCLLIGLPALLLLAVTFATVKLLPGDWGVVVGMGFILVVCVASVAGLQKLLGIDVIVLVLKRFAPKLA
jgi:enterobacterial common antigen flippase